MKSRFLFLFFLVFISARGQSLAALQNALNSSDKVVQAIHSYPASIYHGKCHWVPVKNIVILGNQLTITEKWQSPYGLADDNTDRNDPERAGKR
jgi:hypothetical protein